MTVVLDTNAVVQMFGVRSQHKRLKGAITEGQLNVAISTAIWLEYEEVIVRYARRVNWERVAQIFDLTAQLYETILHVEPRFHWRLITTDPDDDKFADCAIAAEADFLITEDGHFAVLRDAGHKPQPITPESFVRDVLEVGE